MSMDGEGVAGMWPSRRFTRIGAASEPLLVGPGRGGAGA